MSIRILSYNIHGGHTLGTDRDLRRIHAVLEEHDVDIGVFQEFETRVSRGGLEGDIELIAGPERPYHLPGPCIREGEGWYGNLIISRHPIIRALNHNLETKPDLEPRSAIDALIETPEGKLRVIGTHLSLISRERWNEANNLISLVRAVEETEKNPLFLVGDINEWKLGAKLMRYLNRILIPLPCGASFPSAWPVLKLDRVWHDEARMKVSARTLRGRHLRKLSDHLPVLVEIEFPQSSNTVL